MKLAWRFVLAAILPVAVIIVGNGALRVKREVRLLTEEVAIHQRAMGQAMAAGVEHVFASGGDAAARALIDAAKRKEALVDLRWVSGEEGALAALRPVERASLEAGEVFVEGAPGGDEALRSLVPVWVGDTLVGSIELVERLDREDAYLDDTVARVGVNTLLAIVSTSLLMVLMGWLLVARRVDRLVAWVRGIGAGDDRGDAEPESFGRDELGELAHEIAAMQRRLAEARAELDAETDRRLRTLEALRHADRLSTVGKLASGMAHELGTPLNVALGRARMLQEGVAPEKQAAYVDVIIKQIERISGIVRQVLDFSRRNTPQKRVVDLHAIAAKTVSLLEPSAKKSGVEIAVAGSSVSADVDPIQVDQVVANLVVNAIQACRRGDRIVVETGRAQRPQLRGQCEDCAFIKVTDDGPGMPLDVLEKVFDPFFTTKDIGEGTGLGLSVAHGIAADHGGEITVESEPGRGATFTLWLSPMEETV